MSCADSVTETRNEIGPYDMLHPCTRLLCTKARFGADGCKTTGGLGQAFVPCAVVCNTEGSRRGNRRVGKPAHDPLRSRCPRAAPNPFLRSYGPAFTYTLAAISCQR